MEATVPSTGKPAATYVANQTPMLRIFLTRGLHSVNRMRKHWGWAFVYRGAHATEWICGVLALVMSASLKADPAAIPVFTAQVRWLQHRSAISVFFAVVAIGVCGLVKRWAGPPWVWSAIHSSLNGFRDVVFATRKAEPEHLHRVTLFKFSRFPTNRFRFWAYGRWLVPVERSGATTRLNVSSFHVPDDGEHVEGVAGQAWARSEGEVFMTDALPEVSTASSDDELENYAKKAFVSVEWVKNRLKDGKPLARRLCGVRLELKGNPWGVLVVDSRLPEKIDRVEEAFKLSGRHLVALLEGART
jgi:hypothetical protein